MKRVRQESAEFYEVSAAEVARALGIFMLDGDDVVITHQHGDKYKILVRHIENEDVELEAPVHDPFSDDGASDLPLVVVIPPPPFAPDDLAITPDALSTGITAAEIEQWNRDDEATV